MKRNLLFTISSLIIMAIALQFPATAQKWSGSGDGTSWNDPANWDSGEVPADMALLVFQKDATVTGTAPNNPGQIKLQKNITVTFDLDLTFGNGVLAEHALTVAAGSTLNLGTDGNNRMFNINIAPNKQCVAIFNNDDASINIAETTTLNIVQGQFGINVGNETCTTTNRGTITFDTLTTTGIKTAGMFYNFGEIRGLARSNGIIVNINGDFVNEESGVIEVSAQVDEAMELLDGSTFTNNGSLMLTGSPTANRNNSALAINAVAAAATFVQNSAVPLNITGTSDSSSIFKIDTLGVFENYTVVNFNGTSADSSLLVSGMFHNMGGAYLNVGTGTITVGETGSFTNDYVLTVADAGSTFDVSGTAVNNGFYDYASGSAFAEGAGTITDNGLPFVTTIDADGSCTVDLADVSLEWFEDGTSVGTSGADGTLTFAESSLANNPTVLTTIIDGVSITVENYCPEAWIDPSNVFDLDKTGDLQVYPTEVIDRYLNINLTHFGRDVLVEVVDLTGRSLQTMQLMGGEEYAILVNVKTPGMYLVRASSARKMETARFFVLK